MKQLGKKYFKIFLLNINFDVWCEHIGLEQRQQIRGTAVRDVWKNYSPEGSDNDSGTAARILFWKQFQNFEYESNDCFQSTWKRFK